jgi:hypothetical protein
MGSLSVFFSIGFYKMITKYKEKALKKREIERKIRMEKIE